MTREEAIQFLNECRERAQKNAEDFEREFPQYQSAWRKDVDVYGMAISALRQQDVTDTDAGKNEPLTLDELLQMNGEPVWVVWPDGRIKSKWWIVNSGWWMDMFWDDHGNISNDYGTVWLAYRQKPEEGTR